ncbi:hypothetical protein JCM8097_002192 [Rhodosporidiobolus ruineniae]
MFTSFLSSPSSLTSLATSATCYAVERSLDKVFALLGESDNQALDTGFEHIHRTVDTSSAPSPVIPTAVGAVLPSSASIDIRTGSASLDSAAPSTSLKLDLAPISTIAVDDDEDLSDACPPSPVSFISSPPPSPLFDTCSLFSDHTSTSVSIFKDEPVKVKEDKSVAPVEIGSAAFQHKVDILEAMLKARLTAERYSIPASSITGAYLHAIAFIAYEEKWEQAYEAADDWLACVRARALETPLVRGQRWQRRIARRHDDYSLYSAGLSLLPPILPLPPFPTIDSRLEPSTVFNSFTAFAPLPPRAPVYYTELTAAAFIVAKFMQARRPNPVLAAAQLGKSTLARPHFSAVVRRTHKEQPYGAIACAERCKESPAAKKLESLGVPARKRFERVYPRRYEPEESPSSSSSSTASSYPSSLSSSASSSSSLPTLLTATLAPPTTSASAPLTPHHAHSSSCMRYGAERCSSCCPESPAEEALRKMVSAPLSPRIPQSYSSEWLI